MTLGGTRSKVGLAVVVLLAVVARAGVAQGEIGGRAPRDGEELYAAACASCHGVDGTGLPRSVVGFEEPLPDFTDCRFTTREPNTDWIAVVHDGGPARGFSRMMPAFGEALSVAEVEVLVGHLRSFCNDGRWPRGELNLPRPLVTEKAFPEDEVVLSTSHDPGRESETTAQIVYERRVGARSQVEIAVPFQWTRVEDTGAGGAIVSRDGIGDVGLSFKRALYHSLERGAIFSVSGEIKLPTGDEDRGLGKGTAILEPFLTFGKILPADGFLQLQGGFEIPTDHDKAEDEAFFRLAVGKSFTQGSWGRTWSPMLEVLGARELIGGAEIEWDLVPQVQVTLSKRQHIMANVGLRMPTDGSGNNQVLAYLLWDWFDGGLFDGW